MADFTEQNRQYFDKKAKSYKGSFAKVVEVLSRQTRDRRLWISDNWTDTDRGKGKEIKVLEYACGPGHISIALAPFLTKAIGLDISSNMVDEYNKNAHEAGFSDKMAARTGDLLAESLSNDMLSQELLNFDLVIVSMALHHFSDPSMAMKRLGGRLKEGGALYIIDFVPADHNGKIVGEATESAKTVKTHGFNRDAMWKLCLDAGLNAGFDYQIIEEPIEMIMGGKKMQKMAFAARCQRM